MTSNILQYDDVQQYKMKLLHLWLNLAGFAEMILIHDTLKVDA